MKRALLIAYSMQKGGMERQLSIFLNNFDRKKLKISLALFRKKIEYPLPDDVEVIDLKKEGRFNVFFAFRLIRLVISPKFHVINCKLSTISHNIMWICALFFKNNLIIEVRSSGKGLIPFYNRVKFFHKILRVKWSVACNSKRAYSEAKAKLPESISLKYIPNGISTSTFKRMGTDKGTLFKVGFVGRILPLKNLRVLIEAFHKFQKEVSNSQLVLVGSVYDRGYMKNLTRLLHQLHLTEKVLFKKNIEEVEKFYNGIDVFVLPSVYEGTPNVLLEAMSCETICLISKGANSDDFLPDEFVFSTYNSQELFEKMKRIYLTDKLTLQELAVKNREIVLENYSIHNMVDLLTNYLLQQTKQSNGGNN